MQLRVRNSANHFRWQQVAVCQHRRSLSFTTALARDLQSSMRRPLEFTALGMPPILRARSRPPLLLPSLERVELIICFARLRWLLSAGAQPRFLIWYFIYGFSPICF